MGLYDDPWQEFGRLSMELMRAGRLVTDTGVHALRWSREKAVAWLDENTPSNHADNITAVQRYIVTPGQACAYEMGKLKLVELRDRARAKQIGRAQVWTPVTTAHLVCRLLLEQKKHTTIHPNTTS